MLSNKVRAAEGQEIISPLVALENAFCYWWIVALCIIVGGLGGLYLYSLKPAIYEATAHFSIAIDYASTGPITQYEEDQAINNAGNTFFAKDVLQQVIDQAASEGIKTSVIDLEIRGDLERKFSVWDLRVRDSNPQVAERLATIWLNAGESALQHSYQRAIQTHLLNRYIQSQERCLERAAANEPAHESCDRAHITEIQKNLKDAGAARDQEKFASRNLFPGLMLGPFNAPRISQKPVSYGRNQYVFLGSLLGLLTGIAVIELGAWKFRRKKN